MFGKRLKELREQYKMFQSDLAAKLNLATSTISMYERGERDPDTDTLKKIAEIFETSTDYLLGRTDNPSPKKELDFTKDKIAIATYGGLETDIADLPDDVKARIEHYIKLEMAQIDAKQNNNGNKR